MKIAALCLCFGLVLKGATTPELFARNVVNAADYRGGAVAPSEIVVLYPTNAGPPEMAPWALETMRAIRRGSPASEDGGACGCIKPGGTEGRRSSGRAGGFDEAVGGASCAAAGPGPIASASGDLLISLERGQRLANTNSTS